MILFAALQHSSTFPIFADFEFSKFTGNTIDREPWLRIFAKCRLYETHVYTYVH